MRDVTCHYSVQLDNSLKTIRPLSSFSGPTVSYLPRSIVRAAIYRARIVKIGTIGTDNLREGLRASLRPRLPGSAAPVPRSATLALADNYARPLTDYDLVGNCSRLTIISFTILSS